MRRPMSTLRWMASALIACGLGLGSVVAGGPAIAGPPASGSSSSHQAAVLHGQKPVQGFFRGRAVQYLDEGQVALATGADGSFLSDVDPIWAVTNGPAGQHNIIDNVPGLNHPDDYTPLWQVITVTWTGGHPRILRSAYDVRRAQAAGWVTVTTTDTIVNCPVLGFGQPKVAGFFRTTDVKYLDEGPIRLATGADGSFLSDVDPIWAVTNGPAGQHNIIDNVPGLNHPDDYTPLWQVTTVTWAAGLTPVTLTSRADVEAAAANGWVTVSVTDTVVNCPVL